MSTRRNFHPDQPDASYLHKHIKFQAFITVDLHNVGDEFSLSDAVSWLNEAIERGLKSADPNDKAEVVEDTAMLLSRPDCECYQEQQEQS